MGLLAVNQMIKSLGGNSYVIKKILGAGCQGEVYEAADKKRNSVAIKIYYHDKLKQVPGAFERQYNIISQLVTSKNPDDRLAWPYDFISYNETFGYVMGVVPRGYVSIKKFLTEPKYYSNSTFSSKIRACYNLSEIFQRLHIMGYSYGDISDNNIMIRPETGDIFVIDNDNVVINGEIANILGTPEFIAPELFLPNAAPNRQTDLFSLAVLLFKLLYLSHPLLGQKEPPKLTKETEFDLFIKNPIFIYDPVNTDNRPDPKRHANAVVYWNIYPNYINNMFLRSFTIGLRTPLKRLFESEWKTALVQLENLQIICQKNNDGKGACNTGNFFDKEKEVNRCWHCGEQLTSLRLIIRGSVSNEIALSMGLPTKISEHALYNNDMIDKYVGILVRNAKDESIIGIKNVTDNVWQFIRPNGMSVKVIQNQAIPIIVGSKIIFDENKKIVGEIVR